MAKEVFPDDADSAVSRFARRRIADDRAEIGSVENIVAKHQRDGISADEGFPDQERLCQSFRFRYKNNDKYYFR